MEQLFPEPAPLPAGPVLDTPVVGAGAASEQHIEL